MFKNEIHLFKSHVKCNKKWNLHYLIHFHETRIRINIIIFGLLAACQSQCSRSCYGQTVVWQQKHSQVNESTCALFWLSFKLIMNRNKWFVRFINYRPNRKNYVCFFYFSNKNQAFSYYIRTWKECTAWFQSYFPNGYNRACLPQPFSWAAFVSIHLWLNYNPGQLTKDT